MDEPFCYLREMINPLKQVPEGVGFNFGNGESLSGFLQQARRQIPALDHILGDFEITGTFVRGQMIHQVEHQLFQNHAQATGTHLAEKWAQQLRP